MKLFSVFQVVATFIILSQYREIRPVSSVLFLVQGLCVARTIWTPVPATVNNLCLQCICTATNNYSLCKVILSQFSPICSALGTTIFNTGTITNPLLINPRAPIPGVVLPATGIAVPQAPVAGVFPAVQPLPGVPAAGVFPAVQPLPVGVPGVAAPVQVPGAIVPAG